MNIAYRRLLPARLRRWLRSLVVECSTVSCRGFHLSHPILRRLPGIFLSQGWYCSLACVREALQERVAAQRRMAVIELRQPPRMPFRLVLLAGGRVTEEQLAEARRVQASGELGRDRKQDLGEALVQLGYASEQEVAAARAREAGYPYYSGEAQPLPSQYQLPLTLMRQYQAVPVHYNPVSGRLLVGFVYRVDRSLLQAVEQVMACRVEACIVGGSSWIQRTSHGGRPAQEEVIQAASSQSGIVDLIVEEALASHADRIAIGLTGKTLWARLEGGPRARDLVIEVADDPGGEDRADDAGIEEAKPVRASARLRSRGLGSERSSAGPSGISSLRTGRC